MDRARKNKLKKIRGYPPRSIYILAINSYEKLTKTYLLKLGITSLNTIVPNFSVNIQILSENKDF